MYAGAAYATAPYAGISDVEAATDLSSAAIRMRVGGGIYVETNTAVALPDVNTHSYVVALVYDIGLPVYPATTLFPSTTLYPQGV